MKTMTVIGSFLSPYVRKVLVTLELKNIAYEVDPIVPFYGNDAFSRLSPARRIPVLLDGDQVILDSTVIVEYLDEQYPQPALLPATPAQRARARWIEEYADSVLGDIFIWRYYNQMVINRFVWGNKPDEAVLKQAVDVDIPAILDYLESFLPAEGYLFGAVSNADIAVAAFFRNLFIARYELDATRWPNTSAFVQHLHALPAFAKLQTYENLCMRAPILEHRRVLAEAGAPIAAHSFGQETPRHGVVKR